MKITSKSVNMEMNELILGLFQLDELILGLFQLECKLFMKTDSYHIIEQKCNNKCLTQNEMQQLNAEIQYDFTLLIKTIKKACPSLTAEDVLFCCLTISGLGSSFIAHCMGDVSKQPINQRKYRIKKKMQEAQCGFLFDMIFTCYSL